jgi:Branched-chain amino acid transport system / permease component
VWQNRFIAYVAAAAGCGLAGGILFMTALFITVTTGFDLNWVVAMIFIVIIGGIGTLEGPIIGTVLYYGMRELLTNTLGLSGSWYLIALARPPLPPCCSRQGGCGRLSAGGSVSPGCRFRASPRRKRRAEQCRSASFTPALLPN